MSHTHIHTHVNTHFCDCGSTHVSAHAHALVIDNGNVMSLPSTSEMILPSIQKKEPPVAQRTRSKMQRITWENTPWHIDDRDIVDLLAFLLLSDDPWERSLIPAVEKDAIDRAAKRAKKAVV